MHLLYNLIIWFYGLSIRLAAPFNPKARLFVHGRKGWREKLTRWRKEHPGKVFWFHCASLGEFEQGRPLMERIRRDHPGIVLLLTFFSPSGYEVRKDFQGVDGVMYLPLDTPGNAKFFVRTLEPWVVIFVKYDIWANFFLALHRKSRALFVLSARFRAEQFYFRWPSPFWRNVLHSVLRYFVQDEESVRLLAGIGVWQAIVAGDTRFDRVIELAAEAKEFPLIQAFTQNHTVVVGGSCYAEEEIMLKQALERHPKLRLILAPHELNERRLADIERLFEGNSVRYTALQEGQIPEVSVLILDTMGMLSSVYRYGTIAVVGGGFGRGIHNVLEAAVYGIPVFFGPEYHKFIEAEWLQRGGGAFSRPDQAGLLLELDRLLCHPWEITDIGKRSAEAVKKGSGAVDNAMYWLKNFF